MLQTFHFLEVQVLIGAYLFELMSFFLSIYISILRFPVLASILLQNSLGLIENSNYFFLNITNFFNTSIDVCCSFYIRY